MSKTSAGLLLYRFAEGRTEVLLVHPGGPYWAKKDEHAWSIPKGEAETDEDMVEAAKREFKEEIGQDPPAGELQELGSVKVSGGKTNHVWALEGSLDVSSIKSNMTTVEWPPSSGQTLQIPEVDKAEWVTLDRAQWKLHKGQAPFIDRLASMLGITVDSDTAGSSAPQQSSLF